MNTFDFKKEYKDLYQPKTTPNYIYIEKMKFFQVEGLGNPNDINGDYQKAVQLLYAFSYAVKMSYKTGFDIDNFFAYSVLPLEGLWQQTGMAGYDLTKKDLFEWKSLIRQPDFVNEAVFEKIKVMVKRKHPELNVDKVKLIEWEEGSCVQCMHIGPYDDEPSTLLKITKFIQENGLIEEYTDERRHHEIYLSDPRKSKPDTLRTILRIPVKKIES